MLILLSILKALGVFALCIAAVALLDFACTPRRRDDDDDDLAELFPMRRRNDDWSHERYPLDY